MADERRRFELRSGEIVKMGTPSLWHNQVLDRFLRILSDFVDAMNAGRGVRRIVRAGEKLQAPALLPGFFADPASLLPR